MTLTKHRAREPYRQFSSSCPFLRTPGKHHVVKSKRPTSLNARPIFQSIFSFFKDSAESQLELHMPSPNRPRKFQVPPGGAPEASERQIWLHLRFLFGSFLSLNPKSLGSLRVHLDRRFFHFWRPVL